jgi:C-terminal processing protease CtpA/Prc
VAGQGPAAGVHQGVVRKPAPRQIRNLVIDLRDNGGGNEINGSKA